MHPGGGGGGEVARISDWRDNSFIMLAYEKIFKNSVRIVFPKYD